MNRKTFLLLALAAATNGCQEQPRSPAEQTRANTESVPEPVQHQDTAVFANESEAAVYFLNPVFPVLDCERDGAIDQGEIDEHFAQLFFYVDRDQNRKVSLEEYLGAGKKATPAKEELIFNLMDTDQNGIVTAREFRAYALATVPLADANHDGEVTEAEVGIRPAPRLGLR